VRAEDEYGVPCWGCDESEMLQVKRESWVLNGSRRLGQKVAD